MRTALVLIALVGLAACGTGTKLPPDVEEACTVLGGLAALDFHSSGGLQVQIEVRFLDVSQNFLENVGVDFRDVHPASPLASPGFGGQFEDSLPYAAPDGLVAGLGEGEAVIPSDHKPGSYLPNAYVNIPPGLQEGASFVQAPGDDDQCLTIFDLLRKYLSGTDNVPAATPIVPNGVLQPGVGVATTLLDAQQVQVLLNAIGQSSTSDILSAPTLQLYDGQRAMVVAQTGQAPASDLLPIVTSTVLGGVGIDFVQTGITLDVRPVVQTDSSTIRLDIRPLAHGVVATLTGTHLVAGNPVAIQVPILVPTTVQTTVSVPDGGTLLIGGLKNLSDDGQAGVPLLSKLPYVNRLFRNTSSVATQMELVLMVTPRIIIQEEEKR